MDGVHMTDKKQTVYDLRLIAKELKIDLSGLPSPSLPERKQ